MVQPGFDGADGHAGDLGDLVEGRGPGIIRSRLGHEGCFIWEHTGTQHRVECRDHPERSLKSTAGIEA